MSTEIKFRTFRGEEHVFDRKETINHVKDHGVAEYLTIPITKEFNFTNAPQEMVKNNITYKLAGGVWQFDTPMKRACLLYIKKESND